MTARTRPRISTPQRWEVFLSSTILDLETFRDGVAKALKRAEIACFPSEGWVNPHTSTEERCRKKFLRANSFLLLLGYWYGWVEKPGEKSITHKEFDWALQRWGSAPDPDEPPRDAPMAVLIPAPNSAAAAELRARARQLVEDPARGIDASAHEAQVKAFHAQARDEGRTFMAYNDLPDLREIVIILTHEWSGDTPMAAARAGPRAHEPTHVSVADVELGDLGRQAQFDAVATARASMFDDGDAPAIALLAHGNADAAQGCFLDRLLVRELRHPARCRGTLMASCNGLEGLCEKIAQLMGLDLGGVQTPRRLAELAAVELARRPLAFVLERAGAYPGGLEAIESQWWAPFHQHLQALHRAQALRHGLVAVFGDFSGRAQGWLAARAAPAMSSPARATFHALPPLQPYTRAQVRIWLNRLGVPETRHGAIIQSVSTDDAGADDMTPLRVVDRLRRENLQLEEDDE